LPQPPSRPLRRSGPLPPLHGSRRTLYIQVSYVINKTYGQDIYVYISLVNPRRRHHHARCAARGPVTCHRCLGPAALSTSRLYTHTHIYIYIYIYIHTHTHSIYIYIYIYIYINMQRCRCFRRRDRCAARGPITCDRFPGREGHSTSWFYMHTYINTYIHI